MQFIHSIRRRRTKICTSYKWRHNISYTNLPPPSTIIIKAFSTHDNNNNNNNNKNDILQNLPNNYDPMYSNTKKRYLTWEANGYFNPDSIPSKKLASPDNNDKDNYFSMVLPPPNVTGSLHIGHALTVLIQDSLARWQRMKGKNVLWVPGLDHAGIATQVVVEKQLMRDKGLTRHDLGREKFLEQVWNWYEKYGDTIYKQLKELGASLDWSRSAFTMDEQRSKAVTEAFVQLYERGLIFRGRRIVNWCPILNTAISDIEIDLEELNGRTTIQVPYIEKKNDDVTNNTKTNVKQKHIPVEFGIMYKIEYPLSNNDDNNNNNEKIIISTTRPETIPADVAIAVHSEDPRYQFLFEENAPNVLHPLTGEILKVVQDDILVDPELGSGVVKITPSHDLNDYECALRHNLTGMNIMDDDGYLNDHAENCNLNGLNRYHARVEILNMLKEKGLFKGEDDHPMTLTRCSRSGDVLEPLLKPQWFVNCNDLANESIKMVNEKKKNDGTLIDIRPSKQIDEWNRWLENIQDWCISRQLWWGHRIPAYKIVFKNGRNNNISNTSNNNGNNDLQDWIIARTIEDARKAVVEKYNGIDENDFHLIQDEDVLDTWFSSALFPLSALGWPNDNIHATNEKNKNEAIQSMLPANTASYYPLSLMETGVDILFFWVARMSMICTELTSINNNPAAGSIESIPPFEKVFLHPLVRDKDGKKMSKSLGNVIDPLHIINGVSLKGMISILKSGNLDKAEIKRAEKNLKKDFPKGIDALGVDSLRYALASYLKQGRQINIDIQRVITARQFCNKIWHASKYVISNVDLDNHGNNYTSSSSLNASNLENQWILNRLHDTIQTCEEGFSTYNFALATDALRTFFINDFCDVYLELTKKYLNSNANNNDDSTGNVIDPKIKLETQNVLKYVLDSSLRMFHPIIPFITEDLYEVLHPNSNNSNEDENSIMMSSFPTTNELESFKSDVIEKDMDVVLKSVHGLRSLRNTMLSLGVQASSLSFSLNVASDNNKDGTLSTEQINIIKFLSRLPNLNIILIHENDSNTMNDISDDGSLKYAVNDNINLNVTVDMTIGPVKDNLIKEINLLTKREKKINKQISNFHTRMSLQDYKDKVPQHVQKKDIKKLDDLKVKIIDVQNSLETLTRLVK